MFKDYYRVNNKVWDFRQYGMYIVCFLIIFMIPFYRKLAIFLKSLDTT